MRAVDDGLGTIHVFAGTKNNEKQFQELMKDYRLLEQEIVDLKGELINQDKYIEKLKKEYDNQLQQKENIIKEVREYIQHNIVDYITNYDDLREELLEILEKGE